jgi:hypothetical protein
LFWQAWEERKMEEKKSIEDKLKEQRDFYKAFSKEVEECKDCKIIRGNRKLMLLEEFCLYHEEVYREMEGYVI